MKSIKRLIADNLRYKTLRKPLEAARVCDAARELSGGRFGVISFRNGLLTLAVQSSFQAANLQAENESFISELNQKLGEKAVERVRFKIE